MNNVKNCPLFSQISSKELRMILKNSSYRVSTYWKDQVIAVEGEECSNLGIVLKGAIEIKRLYATGKVITMARHMPGDIFGEVMIFSESHQYPATIISLTNTSILYISQKDIIELCRLSSQFLFNFMSILSNRILILNQKIKNLSYETIRQKIANYLLEEYSKQKTLTLTVPHSRKEMAELLGVPRPSLSRELIHMRDGSLIDFYKNTIKIKNVSKLEECLF